MGRVYGGLLVNTQFLSYIRKKNNIPIGNWAKDISGNLL